jgi:hypothetical protein
MTLLRGSAALLVATAFAVPLAGCDKAQTAGQGAAKKADTQAWEGVTAAGAGYTASGYKAGDKAAWEAQLKARTERGQNEYTHVVSNKP